MTFLRILGATAQKDFRTAISYRVGFVTSIIATFWGLFAFRFVSKLVNSGQFSSSSTSYFKYTVVGLLFASILEPTAVGTSVSARNDQVQGTLEYLSTQPVRRAYIGFSWSAFNLLQSLLVAAIVVLLTIPLGFSVSDVNVPVVLVVIPLTILIFGAVGNMGASLVILLQQGVERIGERRQVGEELEPRGEHGYRKECTADDPDDAEEPGHEGNALLEQDDQ